MYARRRDQEVVRSGTLPRREIELLDGDRGDRMRGRLSVIESIESVLFNDGQFSQHRQAIT